MSLPADDDHTMMMSSPPVNILPLEKGKISITGGHNALPVGTRMSEFEITELIGEGGFGIVYLAHDHSLQRNIALKEYMPSTLAERTAKTVVAVKTEAHLETFEAGLRSFVNEARMLAQFDHPSLVKVYRFWESNGTAYMVMPFYQGLTLKETLRKNVTPPDEAWLRNLLIPILDALEFIHQDQCFHRDIAPDNILILNDGSPLLLDFGAARRAISGMTQAFTVILKQGYAPVEQYVQTAAMQQGAWTDIYALASVIYFAITGSPPTASVARIISDPQIPLEQQFAGKYSKTFLRAIDRGLAVKPEDRPQNIAEFRALLGMEGEKSSLPKSIRAGLATGGRFEHVPPKPNANTAGKRNWKLYAGGAAVVVAIMAAIGIGYVLTAKDKPLPVPPVHRPDPIKVQEPSKIQEPKIQEPKAPETKTQASVSQTTTQPTSTIPAGPVITTPPVLPAFDPMQAINDIYNGRNPDQTVTVSVEKAQVRIGKDHLHFSVNSSKPGYLYVLMVGTDRSQFLLLFPNAIDKNNRIAANSRFDLPHPKWGMSAFGPAGTDQFVVMVSDSPRDFHDAGLKKADLFAEFPLATAAQLQHDNGGSGLAFAGKPVCANGGTAGCSSSSSSFGAALFSIEEVTGR